MADVIPAQVGKITLTNFGKPDASKLKNGAVIAGYLVGKARSFIERTQPKEGTKFEGLTGAFRLIPSDPDGEVLESGVLFIPDAFHNLIADQLRTQQRDDPKAEIEFAFEVAAMPANNPAGYSWKFNPAFKFAGVNPLDEVQKKLVAARPKALPKPK